MSLAVADLQKQREEVRARLLANEAVRGRIAFRAYEIDQRRGDGHGGALKAEGEIVSSLVEQELQLSSASTDRKGFKDKSREPRVKLGKKSQSRAASVSDTVSKRKAKTKQAGPTSAKTVKGEMNTGRAAKKPSGASMNRKERSRPESKSV